MAVKHRTLLGLQFKYSILGNTQVDWFDIGLKPCLGISLYELNLNVAQVCMKIAWISFAKQGSSWFEQYLQNI